jgi:hypothetical protein
MSHLVPLSEFNHLSAQTGAGYFFRPDDVSFLVSNASGNERIQKLLESAGQSASYMSKVPPDLQYGNFQGMSSDANYGSEALDSAEHLGLILGSQKQANALLKHFVGMAESIAKVVGSRLYGDIIVAGTPECCLRKARSVRLNSTGCSSIEKWPAFLMTTSVLLGIPSLSSWDSDGGVIISFSPTITSVGIVMRDSKSLVSDV